MVWSHAIWQQLSAWFGTGPQTYFHCTGNAHCLFIQCEQMAGFCSVALTSKDVWTKEPMDMRCYVSGDRQHSGMFEMTSSLLKSIHFLTFEQGIVFKGAVALHLPWGLCTTGTVWKSLHILCPVGRLHPIVGPPGVWTQARPPSVFVTHCSPLYCDRPRFTTAVLGHLVLQRLPPVSEEGSFTKLGSMICPFVGCISCSASCDVTD